jgi:hypothetical protein
MNRCKVALVLGLMLVGCSPSNLSRQVTRGAIDGTSEQLTRPDTQQDLQEASRDPEVREATENLTAAVADGVIQALESDRAQQRMSEITRAVTQAAVQQMIAALSGDRTRAQIELIARGATDAALKQASENMREDVGPAIRALLEGDVTKGFADALNSDPIQDAIARESQTFAHNAVLGWNSGAKKAWEMPEGALQSVPGVYRTIAIAGGVGLVLVTLIALSVAVMFVARARQTGNEVARLESATLLLATMMREKQETQQTDEILAVVQHALEGRAERTGKHRILDALRMRKTG